MPNRGGIRKNLDIVSMNNMEGKLCLTNLIAFHNEQAELVDKNRTLNIDFNNVSATALYCLLPEKLMKHKNAWRVRQTEK